jgi:hypothetical protein
LYEKKCRANLRFAICSFGTIDTCVLGRRGYIEIYNWRDILFKSAAVHPLTSGGALILLDKEGWATAFYNTKLLALAMAHA